MDKWNGQGFSIKRKDGKYLCGKFFNPFTQKTERREVKIQTSKKEARERLRKKINSILQPANTLTIDNFYKYWFEHKVKNKALKTQKDYAETYTRYIKKPLGHIPMEKVTSHLIQQIIQKIEKKGYKRTAQKVHTMISQLFNDAGKFNLYDGINPAQKMFAPVYKSPEQRVLTQFEAQRLLEASKEHRLGIVIQTAMETAMRPSEYLGLRWNNVDLDQRKVFVREQVQHIGKKYHFVPPKHNSTRNITISEHLTENLIKWKEKQKNNDLNLVFPSLANTPLRIDNFRKRTFKEVLRLAGLDETHKLYVLRHTTATLALQSGTALKLVSALLGHKDINVTAKIYAHYIPEMEDEVSEAVSGMIYGKAEENDKFVN